MKIYFRIQLNIINRYIKESGLNIVLAWVLSTIAFFVLSIFFFSNYEYAEYIYLVIPVFLSLRLKEYKREEFLKICYDNRKRYLIRGLENLIISIPFLIVLLIHQAYLISALLLLIIPLLNLYKNGGLKSHFTILTPFQSKPFEFTVGFRKSVFLIILIYALSIISISVDNLNLGLFALILSFLNSISYYSYMEDEFYVWSHKEKPNEYLWKKVLIGILLNSLLYLPLMAMLLFFFPENMLHLLILYSVGCFFMMAVVFMKYAAFPHKIGFKESIVLSISLYFPPIILLTFPYFYYQSIKSLKKVLK